MAISVFYESIQEKDLGKLALTVPQGEFEIYKAWALSEYIEGEETEGARLDYGTKADYKYKFYEYMRFEDVYFFDRQTDGTVTGALHIADETDRDNPVTEHFLYFRVFEEEKGKEYLYNAVSKLLRLTNDDNLIVNKIVAETPEHAVVFLTGVGKVFPFVRSHNVLNNLHQILDRVPVVMFYPGNWNGQTLSLFGTINDGNYYRAFPLIV